MSGEDALRPVQVASAADVDGRPPGVPMTTEKEHMRVKPDREVTVIDFRYLDEEVATHAAGDGPIAAAAWLEQWGGLRKKVAGRELDGRTWDEMPPRLEVSPCA